MEKIKVELTLTGIKNWLNAVPNYKKKSGKPYTNMDVKAYIDRGHLPSYLGLYKIIKVEKPDTTLKVYDIIKERARIKRPRRVK